MFANRLSFVSFSLLVALWSVAFVLDVSLAVGGTTKDPQNFTKQLGRQQKGTVKEQQVEIEKLWSEEISQEFTK